ncbi:MAG: disulfide bond formation protein B [Steroidobacteraceae bacterium]
MLHWLRTHRRLATVVLALGCFLMFGYALYVQHHDGLEPCPLCIFQRVAVVSLGVVLVLAAALPGRWRVAGNVSAVLIGVAGLAGMAVSARHLYIQSLPPGQVPVCGATLDYMFEVFPVADVLRKVLTGSGECARIDWTFLGLSMPAWVLIPVSLVTVVGVVANWRQRTRVWK